QAEDGIRDFHVTGVQTCALPICPPASCRAVAAALVATAEWRCCPQIPLDTSPRGLLVPAPCRAPSQPPAHCSVRTRPDSARGAQIGRASCRERVKSSGAGG